MEFVKLNNGVEIPMLGFGVFQITLENTKSAVEQAIRAGYRLIDTAQAYGNEAQVGEAVANSGIPREKFFLVTKIWITNAGYEKAKASIERSLKRLQTDYIDLMLIHQPFGDNYGTYRAMEDAYKEGKLRAIGLSNFFTDRYLDISNFMEIKPAVNQMEVHVFDQQTELRGAAEKYQLKTHGLELPCTGEKRSIYRSDTYPDWQKVRENTGAGQFEIPHAKRCCRNSTFYQCTAGKGKHRYF